MVAGGAPNRHAYGPPRMTHGTSSVPPNMRLKLSARGGRSIGNRSVLSAAAAGRSLSAIR